MLGRERGETERPAAGNVVHCATGAAMGALYGVLMNLSQPIGLSSAFVLEFRQLTRLDQVDQHVPLVLF